MKTTSRKFGILSLAIFTLFLAGTSGVRAQTGAPIDLSSYPLVASNAIPVFGNFYFIENFGTTSLPGLDAFGPPLPGDPRPDLPVYYLGSGTYMIDNSNDPNPGFSSMARGGMMMEFGDFSPMLSFDTNALWLDISAITNGMIYADLNNATNQVYEILTKTDLSLTNWTIESEVWPTNPVDMPFTLYQNGRTNLFVWAMDWTGVTENGNTTPDWWFWLYFGTMALSDGNQDVQGNTLLSYYENSLNPDLITFSVSISSPTVGSNSVPVQLNVTRGFPFGIAMLVNDTNFGDAVWSTYSSSNVLVSLGTNEGQCTVWIGLRGYSTNFASSWLYFPITVNSQPPVITVTSPAASVSVPVVQVQGTVSESLASFTYDLTNSAGLVTNQIASVVNQFADTTSQTITTNYFQCCDVTFAPGENILTLHATDFAGNTTSSSYVFTLDTTNDTTPPVITVNYPMEDSLVAATNFTLIGNLDDDNAFLTVSNNNGSQSVSALVERGGTFYATNLALPNPTNYFTLFATDPAGNTSMQSLTVLASSLALTVDPLTPDELSQPTITVTGTISDSSQNVWVNGILATVSGNNWSADISAPISGSLNGLIQAGASLSSTAGDLAFTTPLPAMIQPMSYSTRDEFHDTVDEITSTVSFDSTNVQIWSLGEGGGIWNRVVDPPSAGIDSFTPFPTNWPGGLVWENGFLENSKAEIAGDDDDDLIFPEWIQSSHSANTVIQLTSGGVASLGVTKLLRLTATASAYSVSDQNFNAPGDTPLLGNQIQLLGQTMAQTATNPYVGELYVTLPAGFSEGITPQFLDTNGGPLNDPSFDVQVQDTNIQITADGNPLDANDVATNASFCVGQAVTFSLSTNLPPGITATNFHWSFQGNYFNSQSNAVPSMTFPQCSTVPYIDSSLLTLNQTTNWWVSGGLNPSSNYIASVYCTLMFTNGNSAQPFHTQAEFEMFRPQAKITPVTTSVNVQIVGTSVELVFAHGTNEGIVFYNTVIIPTNVSGSVEWIQVCYLPANEATDTNRTNHTLLFNGSGPYLDTTYPYSTNIVLPGSTTPVDSPGVTLNTVLENYILVEGSDSNEMWMGFHPTGGYWVPLRGVRWGWSGTATNSTLGWSLQSGTNSPNPTDFDTQDYPLWRSNVTNTQWMPPL